MMWASYFIHTSNHWRVKARMLELYRWNAFFRVRKKLLGILASTDSSGSVKRITAAPFSRLMECTTMWQLKHWFKTLDCLQVLCATAWLCNLCFRLFSENLCTFEANFLLFYKPKISFWCLPKLFDWMVKNGEKLRKKIPVKLSLYLAGWLGN